MNEKLENTEGVMTIDRLATMMMDGFAHLNSKIDDLEIRLSTRIDRIEARLGSVEAGLKNLERKMDRQFDITTARLDDHEVRKVSRFEFDKAVVRLETLENVPKTA